MKPAVVRFEVKVMPEPNTGCWLWIAAVGNGGYGNFWLNGDYVNAHKASWLIFRGDTEGKLVLHTCDVKCCVNPDHLFLGTQSDNMVDMNRKGRGRQPSGSSHFRSKLTLEQVMEIRKSDAAQMDIAIMYGISDSQVSRIKSGKTRKKQ